jgi:hypothetical protein
MSRSTDGRLSASLNEENSTRRTVAIQQADESGRAVKWGDQVSDREYLAAAATERRAAGISRGARKLLKGRI